MGQKASPIANRLGITKGWEASWYSRDIRTCLQEDIAIRNIFDRKLQRIISRIYIERINDAITITVHASKPGILIGPAGKTIQSLKAKCKKKIGRNITINIVETKNPELNARIVANKIAQDIEDGRNYKQATKRAMEETMRNGAGGVKVSVAGRLGGVEIARSINYKKEKVPTQTLRADISYGKAEAHTTYGVIGVTVHVYIREIYGKRSLILDEPAGTNKRRRKEHYRK